MDADLIALDKDAAAGRVIGCDDFYLIKTVGGEIARLMMSGCCNNSGCRQLSQWMSTAGF